MPAACLVILASVSYAAGPLSCLARTPAACARTTMLFNSDRSRRSASANDRKVTLSKPLGVELVNGPSNTVIIGDILPGTNAADAAARGLIKKGDIVTMCSATFGNGMWSTRGVGRERVIKAIAVRAGPVSLVLETPETFKANSKAAMMADERAKQVRSSPPRPHRACLRRIRALPHPPFPLLPL
jgi:hypothetical protein